ncbi:nitroreductase/quinone reductase family protein [Phaeacidiphilus oryzae]|uniref:nitroreductase/quinone reductase family protein n=1 Tax=Phaeacidiphilus oryzae TaxID=348818 RepID=UPI000A05545F|nr:nitroreductase/quinone reductase family protein [Phaeacidiphilus oryzae]
MSDQPRLLKPTGTMQQLSDRFFRGTLTALAKAGIGTMGTHILAVRGRKSGEWRTTPVFPLEYEGARYLVAPRGHTQWVRNMRVTGGGELRLGRRTEAFTATELADDDKLKTDVLRAYLTKWTFLDKQFFPELSPTAPDEDYAAQAPGYPVFRITPAAS